jgi:hypothetical protein
VLYVSLVPHQKDQGEKSYNPPFFVAMDPILKDFPDTTYKSKSIKNNEK